MPRAILRAVYIPVALTIRRKKFEQAAHRQLQAETSKFCLRRVIHFELAANKSIYGFGTITHHGLQLSLALGHPEGDQKQEFQLPSPPLLIYCHARMPLDCLIHTKGYSHPWHYLHANHGPDVEPDILFNLEGIRLFAGQNLRLTPSIACIEIHY